MAFDTSPTRASTAHTSKGALTAKAESKTLVAAYTDRIRLFVANPGEKDVWLALGETAKAKEGIFLAAKTGKEVIEGYSGIVAAITTEGESLVTFAEL